ncbi:hypothetical protein KAW80_02010 [Candidatus Babeliales bacterium]|nr:hypothetical protein [Candidatus Babeliales bacterium]
MSNLDSERIKQVYQKKTDEEILVVPREKILSKNDFNGIKPIDLENYAKIINSSGLFMWRSQAEIDSNFKQIIPYLVFNYEDKYFLMQRKSTSSEVRLKNKYSFGIGGHIRKEDILKKSIIDWSWREFYEEVEYSGNLKIEPIGLLNDETNFVGEVHIGFVFLLKGDSDKIKIRSELKSGDLLRLEECKKLYPVMESWSQYVFNYLSETKR